MPVAKMTCPDDEDFVKLAKPGIGFVFLLRALDAETITLSP